MLRISEDSSGVTIAIKVVPGSSRDRVMGLLGDELKLAVSKPPSGGEANKAVVDLLAKSLALPRAAVQITAGHGNPHKQVRLAGITADQIRARLRV